MKSPNADTDLTIYGSPRSRTLRVLWMAEELALEYLHVPYAFSDPVLKQPEFLALNAAGAIPTIVDRGHALSESLAINLYLAKRYSPSGTSSLYANSLEEESKIWQWSLWAQGHLEPWVQKDRLLADLIEAIGTLGAEMIDRSLRMLESTLANDRWLIGGRFTVGDLNVAAVLSPSRSRALELDAYPSVVAWLERCYSRPAARAVRARFAA